MGCLPSKQKATSSPNIRPRRLSTLLDEDDQETDIHPTPSFSKLPVVEAVQGQRRASYFVQDIDPRTYILSHTSHSLDGLDSGKKKLNQDRLLVHMSESCCIFGVFDGHGKNGHLCSSYMKKHLAEVCIKHLHSASNTTEAIKSTFEELEYGMTYSDYDCQFSGTTATIVLVTNAKMYVAWVGDSPGFVITQNGLRSITRMHNFEDELESKRIVQAGGTVARCSSAGDFVGPLRAFFSKTMIPGLAMSRSIGDTMSKKIGIISQPDVTVQTLDSDDKFILLCSDGLTEFTNPKQILDAFNKDDSIEKIGVTLNAQAQAKWIEEEFQSSDDISCLIVQLCTL